MDSDDVIVIFDEEDEKPVEETNNHRETKVIGPKLLFDDSNDREINPEEIYDDLDNVVNVYVNEEDIYVGEDDCYAADVSFGQDAFSKPKAISKFDVPKNVQQGERHVDEVIVNSHLKEIVDIKNQIRELQDILHDKPQTSSERLKYEDVDEDENADLQLEVSSQNVHLKRSSLTKSEAKTKFVRKTDSTHLFKRPGHKIPLPSRIKTRTVPGALVKVEKKGRSKRNEMPETEYASGSELGLPQNYLVKKTSTEPPKLRVVKKFKPGMEDAAPEEIVDSKLQEMENIPPSVTSSLRKILQMTAHTPEEKYKVLDARDKLYKIVRDKDPTSKTGALVGTCPDMCPEKERLQREFQFQIPIFEMVNYPKNTSLNHNYAVKQYCRSSADQEEPLPHELRPVNVLTMTMTYLLHNVADHCELSDENLGEWYMYMWDRTRALRKELTQQGACNLETVKLVESCARFHIHCAERLVDQDSSIYDDKINTENLTKCLQSLKYMYKDLANMDIYCPNESEFVCYSLLLNLNNTSVFTELSDMAGRVMSSKPVRFALDIMAAWETRNYVRFFNLVKRTTYLNSCILRRYFVEMRLYAIKTMIRSYCTKYYSPQIPIYRFVDNLCFDGIEECCTFLSLCNFEFKKKDDVSVVDLKRVAFRNPETPFPTSRAYVTIEEKKKMPFSMIMAGGELPPKTYEDHIPQNSFTRNGELKLDSLLCKELMDFASTPSVPAALSVQTSKNKLFEPRGEPSRSSKESISQFPDVFGKMQKVAADSKESQPIDKKYPEEKQSLTKLGIKETNSFEGSTASIFGLGTYNVFNVEDGKTEPLFGRKEPRTLSDGNSANKASNIFGSSSNFLFQLGGKDPSYPFQSKTDFNSFKFNVPAQYPGVGTKEENTARSETEGLKIENAKRESESVKEEEEEEDEDEMVLRVSLLEAVKKAKQDAEKREKERIEAEEKERKERERKEQEERIRAEELKMQEKVRKEKLLKLEELARIEEEKRKRDADFKLKVEAKMSMLKKKYSRWKVAELFNKWRLKTWAAVEEKKMKEYFEEVRVRYPAICTEEHLNGNPYGLIIPNVLMLRKYQGQGGEYEKKEARSKRIEVEELPLVDIKEIVAKPLEIRAKRLCTKVDPFLWKLVFSVPDESECSSWKDIETFIEMNFVDNNSWSFKKNNGSLCYHEGCHSTFRYKISVRRARGSDLYEGSKINTDIMTGCNSLIFVMSDDCDINVAKRRLVKVLSSRAPLPQIPLIILLLGDKFDIRETESSLKVDKWLETHLSEYHYEKCSGYTKDELISKVTRCLNLAAEKSGAVTNLRIARLSDFCSTDWFECVWRRIETSLSNYRIILTDPNFVIECYNSSVDELLKLFFDVEYENYTMIGEEFLEKRMMRPKINESYKRKLNTILEYLKLPKWPKETAKSSNQFKFQIHQYCKKVVCEKKKVKELKWLLYRIIRTSLLWKGLDIYCDEDIGHILFNFPWIQFFQELSRFVLQQVVRKMKSENGEQTIVYALDKMDRFSYESSLISKYLDKCTNDRWSLFEGQESSPRLEHDSVIYAYSTALEREKNKRKRETVEENLEDLFRMDDVKRQLLEDEENPAIDVADLKNSFQRMGERLDELKRRMDENAKVVSELESL